MCEHGSTELNLKTLDGKEWQKHIVNRMWSAFKFARGFRVLQHFKSKIKSFGAEVQPVKKKPAALKVRRPKFFRRTKGRKKVSV